MEESDLSKPRDVPDWDTYFMEMARLVSYKSKDRSTQVGCVIVGAYKQVLSTGYNGFPRRIDDSVIERHQRPDKYKWTEHAERNAVYNAAAHGIAIAGATIYLHWFPCSDCARAIIQSGIVEVVCKQPSATEPRHWGDDFAYAHVMLREAGINVRFV